LSKLQFLGIQLAEIAIRTALCFYRLKSLFIEHLTAQASI